MGALHCRQPGQDGGRHVPRFERERYPNLDKAKEEELRLIFISMVELLMEKAQHTAMTEAMIASELARKRRNLERLGKQSMADLLSTTYKGLLSMLSDAGEAVR